MVITIHYIFHTKSPHGFDLFGENGGSGVESSVCYGYWLASPAARGYNLVMTVSYEGAVNGNDYYNTCYGVRPVVSLKSEIYVEVEEKVGKDGKVEKYCKVVN